MINQYIPAIVDTHNAQIQGLPLCFDAEVLDNQASIEAVRHTLDFIRENGVHGTDCPGVEGTKYFLGSKDTIDNMLIIKDPMKQFNAVDLVIDTANHLVITESEGLYDYIGQYLHTSDTVLETTDGLELGDWVSFYDHRRNQFYESAEIAGLDERFHTTLIVSNAKSDHVSSFNGKSFRASRNERFRLDVSQCLFIGKGKTNNNPADVAVPEQEVPRSDLPMDGTPFLSNPQLSDLTLVKIAREITERTRAIYKETGSYDKTHESLLTTYQEVSPETAEEMAGVDPEMHVNAVLEKGVFLRRPPEDCDTAALSETDNPGHPENKTYDEPSQLKDLNDLARPLSRSSEAGVERRSDRWPFKYLKR